MCFSTFAAELQCCVRMKHRQSPYPREVDAVEQQAQFLCRDLHRCRIARRPPVSTLLEALVPDRQSVPIPDQDLHPITALASEQEEMPVERVLLEHAHNRGAQAV